MNSLTTATQSYLMTFKGFLHQFLVWGEWLFFSLLTIQLIWLFIWYAFDKNSLSESLSHFLKRFVVICLFYTLMMNPSWLFALADTAQVMGKTLTHAPIDPSSLIEQGIGIGNQLLLPLEKTSLLTSFFIGLIIAVVYLITLFVFISIALDLALTLILTTALITVASFFLSFAALGATLSIARQTLNAILANCVKLLGLYVVAAVGSQTMVGIASQIPKEFVSFDPYAWIVASVVLFWLVAKNLPSQLARLVSGCFQETQGAPIASAAMTMARTASALLPIARVAQASKSMAKLTGSIGHNAYAHYKTGASLSGSSFQGMKAGAQGAARDLARAGWGNLSARFSDVMNRSAGAKSRSHAIPSVSERLHQSTQKLHQQRKTKGGL